MLQGECAFCFCWSSGFTEATVGDEQVALCTLYKRPVSDDLRKMCKDDKDKYYGKLLLEYDRLKKLDREVQELLLKVQMDEPAVVSTNSLPLLLTRYRKNLQAHEENAQLLAQRLKSIQTLIETNQVVLKGTPDPLLTRYVNGLVFASSLIKGEDPFPKFVEEPKDVPAAARRKPIVCDPGEQEAPDEIPQHTTKRGTTITITDLPDGRIQMTLELRAPEEEL